MYIVRRHCSMQNAECSPCVVVKLIMPEADPLDYTEQELKNSNIKM